MEALISNVNIYFEHYYINYYLDEHNVVQKKLSFERDMHLYNWPLTFSNFQAKKPNSYPDRQTNKPSELNVD